MVRSVHSVQSMPVSCGAPLDSFRSAGQSIQRYPPAVASRLASRPLVVPEDHSLPCPRAKKKAAPPVAPKAKPLSWRCPVARRRASVRKLGCGQGVGRSEDLGGLLVRETFYFSQRQLDRSEASGSWGDTHPGYLKRKVFNLVVGLVVKNCRSAQWSFNTSTCIILVVKSSPPPSISDLGPTCLQVASSLLPEDVTLRDPA